MTSTSVELLKRKKQRLEDLKSEIDHIREEIADISTKCWEQFSKEYIPTYHISVVVGWLEPDCFNDIPEKGETIRIIKTIENAEEIHAGEKKYMVEAPSDWFKEKRSLTYFLYNGVLLSDDCGFSMLRSPMKCSQSEWEQLKSGIIPAEFEK